MMFHRWRLLALYITGVVILGRQLKNLCFHSFFGIKFRNPKSKMISSTRLRKEKR
jgi:hypothetical protein